MSALDVVLRDAIAADLPAIAAIYNHEIAGGVATFDLEPWTPAVAAGWLSQHAQPFTALVAVDTTGAVAGFGAYASYRPKAAYAPTVEDAVYVRPALQRRGIGRLLLAELVERARRGGFHALVGRIEASNEASIGLHEALGFEVVGREREVGFKHGRWLDVVTVELLLE